MKKTLKTTILFISLFTIGVFNCNAQTKVTKPDSEWKTTLTPEQYYILREKGTERPHTGKYNKHYESGTYTCAACKTPLFSSKNKYNSYSGWPSFDAYIENNVALLSDNSHGMTRTEVVCAVCDGHLGHVFNDGPRETTGKRYCINSEALLFQKTVNE